MEPARDVELVVDIVDVVPDRVMGDEQFPLDVLVAFSVKKQIEDLSFPRR